MKPLAENTGRPDAAVKAVANTRVASAQWNRSRLRPSRSSSQAAGRASSRLITKSCSSVAPYQAVPDSPACASRAGTML